MKYLRFICILILSCYSLVFSQTKYKIAVLDFSSRTLPREYLGILSDRLQAEFVAIKRFQVVERSDINKIIEEQNFEQTGYVDTDRAARIGKMSHAQLVALGSVERLANVYTVILRLVHVETGNVLRTADAECEGCSINEVQRNTIRAAVRELAGLPSEHLAQSGKSKLPYYIVGAGVVGGVIYFVTQSSSGDEGTTGSISISVPEEF